MHRSGRGGESVRVDATVHIAAGSRLPLGRLLRAVDRRATPQTVDYASLSAALPAEHCLSARSLFTRAAKPGGNRLKIRWTCCGSRRVAFAAPLRKCLSCAATVFYGLGYSSPPARPTRPVLSRQFLSCLFFALTAAKIPRIDISGQNATRARPFPTNLSESAGASPCRRCAYSIPVSAISRVLRQGRKGGG